MNDDWVLAWIAAGVLVLPRSQICTVEQTDTLLPADPGALETGWFTKPSEPWAAYSFDGDMELQARRQSERFTVFLEAGDRGIGFNCERLKLLPGAAELKEFPTSVCMKNDGPLSALGLLDGEQVLLMSSGPALVRHLERLRTEGRL